MTDDPSPVRLAAADPEMTQLHVKLLAVGTGSAELKRLTPTGRPVSEHAVRTMLGIGAIYARLLLGGQADLREEIDRILEHYVGEMQKIGSRRDAADARLLAEAFRQYLDAPRLALFDPPQGEA